MTKEELEQWVDDLQSGMYINCVYCGHRYGPNSVGKTTMRKALGKHISKCPKHPLSAAKAEITVLKESVESWKREYRLINAAQIAAEERVRELEAERNLLKSDLDKVERGYDEVSQRRDETVAMCDYLQNTVVKRLQAVLEQLADDKGSAYWTSEEVRKIAREALEILAGKEAK